MLQRNSTISYIRVFFKELNLPICQIIKKRNFHIKINSLFELLKNSCNLDIVSNNFGIIRVLLYCFIDTYSYYGINQERGRDYSTSKPFK